MVVGHEPELHLIVIYIGYWGIVDSLQWDIESTLELEYEGVGIPMSPNSPCFDLICHVVMVYEGLFDSRFTLIHKGILVMEQFCIGDSEQSL